jgi:hypothetical protein
MSFIYFCSILFCRELIDLENEVKEWEQSHHRTFFVFGVPCLEWLQKKIEQPSGTNTDTSNRARSLPRLGRQMSFDVNKNRTPSRGRAITPRDTATPSTTGANRTTTR